MTQETIDRPEIRRLLGLDPAEAPVCTVPPLVGRDQGHFLAGWATFLLRKGGIPARLLLPGPNRESRRIVRFSGTSLEPAAVVVAPADTSLSSRQILAAADILVVPSKPLCNTEIVAAAMATRLPIVAAGLASGDCPLLDETTCLFAATAEPLNLARAMLRIWQDKTLADTLTAAAASRCPQP